VRQQQELFSRHADHRAASSRGRDADHCEAGAGRHASGDDGRAGTDRTTDNRTARDRAAAATADSTTAPTTDRAAAAPTDAGTAACDERGARRFVLLTGRCHRPDIGRHADGVFGDEKGRHAV